jgi:hypothetical protein
MPKHCYRLAYERLREALRHAERGEDAEGLARAQAELDVFIGAMVTDPRKLRAVAQDSPGCAQEIIARAEELDLPRSVLDPVHDVSFARLWLATLDDRQIRMLQGALGDELARRAPVHPAQRGPYRRLPPAYATY